ncbi:hypothetical protein Pfo_007915, partial [Paulownia fortunei]
MLRARISSTVFELSCYATCSNSSILYRILITNNYLIILNCFQLDFANNVLLNMVVTLLFVFLLDNTVPGSQQEQGVQTWSPAEDIDTDPSSLSDYNWPSK